MSTTELLLIDLSGLAHQIWHVSGSEPDPNYVSTQVLARVRALASAHPHAAICCDSGKSFRHDLEPAYKANRDTSNRAPLQHQIALACERLKGDGFPVWSAPGFEADDIIATATKEALAIDDEVTVLIASADKDLLQLVSPRVAQKNLVSGNTLGPDGVIEKFGVKPEQMLDYLCIVGDSSDNVKGVEGIGAKGAAELLKAHGSLETIYAAMDRGVVQGITPAKRTALMAFRDRWPLVRDLIALRTDVPILFAEIAVEREAKAMTDTEPMGPDSFGGSDEDSHYMSQSRASSLLSDSEAAAAGNGNERISHSSTAPRAIDAERMLDAAIEPKSRELSPSESTAAASAAMRSVSERIAANEKPVQRPEVLPALAPRDYSQELEPRTMTEAVQLAQRMFDSRLFSAYGTPQAVLATVLAGRELGLPAMASLRAFHVIEGKPQLSAGAIQSLVLKSGKAEYFRCTERSETRATFITKRDGFETTLTYTIEEGRAAWPKDDTAWKKSGWGRNPADMLVARASSKLARLVYPDVVSGLYAPEEMD